MGSCNEHPLSDEQILADKGIKIVIVNNGNDDSSVKINDRLVCGEKKEKRGAPSTHKSGLKKLELRSTKFYRDKIELSS